MSPCLRGAFLGLALAAAPAWGQRSVQQQEREFQRQQQALDRELAEKRRAADRAELPVDERQRTSACRLARNDLETIVGNPHTYAQQAEARDRIARHCR